jgi:hypothetical protein
MIKGTTKSARLSQKFPISPTPSPQFDANYNANPTSLKSGGHLSYNSSRAENIYSSSPPSNQLNSNFNQNLSSALSRGPSTYGQSPSPSPNYSALPSPSSSSSSSSSGGSSLGSGGPGGFARTATSSSANRLIKVHLDDDPEVSFEQKIVS